MLPWKIQQVHFFFFFTSKKKGIHEIKKKRKLPKLFSHLRDTATWVIDRLAYTCGYSEAVDSPVCSCPLKGVGAHAAFAARKLVDDSHILNSLGGRGTYAKPVHRGHRFSPSVRARSASRIASLALRKVGLQGCNFIASRTNFIARWRPVVGMLVSGRKVGVTSAWYPCLSSRFHITSYRMLAQIEPAACTACQVAPLRVE